MKRDTRERREGGRNVYHSIRAVNDSLAALARLLGTVVGFGSFSERSTEHLPAAAHSHSP